VTDAKYAASRQKGIGKKEETVYTMHLASALEAECEYFLTTDGKILNKNVPEIKILNPLDFVRQLYAEE
jgi:hypothetical protein